MTALPRATYRLQFNSDFRFSDTEQLLSYFDALGISHLYTSPFLKARAGSSHGYDVTDHNAFNPEVGDEASFEKLTTALDQHEMGLILDFVPNHMGIGMADNAWWLDVLEWGQASPYASYFDIDWHSATAPLRGKVLLPFLGAPYGSELESGQLKLAYSVQQGSFAVRYYEHLFPIAPRHYSQLLREIAGDAALPGELVKTLTALAEKFHRLRATGVSVQRQREHQQQSITLKSQLASLTSDYPALLKAIERTLRLYNGTPGQPPSFVHLHRLLERQAYRLAYWKVAADEINYRRFFDINDLAGIRVEREEVFNHTHELVSRLLAEGKLQGLRIDHIDGLYDPLAYCKRLQRLRIADEYRADIGQPLYLLLEKILATHENLRDEWPVAGTTGYEVLNRINGLFVASSARRTIETFYRRFTGIREAFDDIVIAAKRRVIEHLLASEMQVLANLFSRLSETNWRSRDFTLPAMRAALTEVVVHFPVYRTYVTARQTTPADQRDIDWAVGRARRSNPLIDPELLQFIRGVICTELAKPRSGYNRNEVVRLAMKFQQYTGPVMAKSLEDTSFYRYLPLLSLNEVGGDPSQFGLSVAGFHQLNQQQVQTWPHAMVSTATHDNKRGEDVRARLNALTQQPAQWTKRVSQWARLNRSRRTEMDEGFAPDRNDEYLLYQTLVGSWPAELLEDRDPELMDNYHDRIQAYMVKAMREAKRHSSWSHPDEAYEAGVAQFIERLFSPPDNPFLQNLVDYIAAIAPLGVINSLAQTTLKYTLPGVPDLYQGSELWDLNLVDPDNRRPVDYSLRRTMLASLQNTAIQDHAELARQLLTSWQDGRIKLFLIWRLLQLRRRQQELFDKGSYQGLEATGRFADYLCAYERSHQGNAIIVVIPRTLPDMTISPCFPLPADSWENTAVVLPGGSADTQWRNCLTQAQHKLDEKNRLQVKDLYSDLPVAVLEKIDQYENYSA